MSGKISCLIVDDEQTFRNAFKWRLEKEGFTCRIAGTEDAAVRILDRGFFPETAVIDYLIPPGRNAFLDTQIYDFSGGLRLAQYILKMTDRTCRIVLFTGLSGYREVAQKAGVWGFCQKPFGDVGGFIDLLRKGFLRPDEIGEPTLDINAELAARGYGKETLGGQF